MQRTAVLLLALLLTFSCSGARNVAAIDRGRSACFDSARVRSFSSLDQRFVYVRVGSEEHYLLTLDSVYTSLPFATGIKISAGFGRICSDSGATLSYVASGQTIVARIIGVEPVGSREEAQKTAEERTKR